MPRFHVKNSFEIPERKLFVMAGSIVEGEIRAGMFVRVPFNSAVDMTVRIQSIEVARRDGGEDVCLCIATEPDGVELLDMLNIKDETLEVTTDGLD